MLTICYILKSLISIFGQWPYKQLYIFSIKLGVWLLKGKQSRWIINRAKAFNGIFWGVQMHFTYCVKGVEKETRPQVCESFFGWVQCIIKSILIVAFDQEPHNCL
jgi:hypothetical protein